VREARELIARGDVFQVNLAQRFDLGPVPDPWSSYLRLRRKNPAPYAGYFSSPSLHLLSASPELLVETRKDRVVTWPIAGTFPRGDSAEEDAQICADLRGHPKERAEHIMLVDLERNDLGRVCTFGSVAVSELLGIRSYASVHHLVSIVEGRLRPEVQPFGVLRALFPGGTITGAPKIRATEIIRQLEPIPRGPYTGSLGFVDGGGDQTWNILIRTMVVEEGRGHLHAGAGIVWDSIPEREFREAVQKAKVFLELAGVDLRGCALDACPGS
jgi:para-aminobenzoate synthetase component 1